MSGNARTLHAAAGEHLVLGELLRRGIEAYLAQGPTQPGWDILTRRNGAFQKVQVKTIDWPAQGTVTIPSSTIMGNHRAQSDQTQCFDVMVVVLLCKEESRSRFLFLTPKEVRNQCAEPENRNDNNRSMTIRKDLGAFAQYEDKWDKLRLPAQ